MPSDSLVVNMGAPGNQGFSQQPKPEIPMPYIPVGEMHYYYCPRPHAQMARKDGLVIHFPGNIHATDNFNTIQWLENEIADQHPELKHATPEQIEAYKYAKNPDAYVRKQTEAEMEATLTSKLAAVLSKKLAEAGQEVTYSAEDLRAMLADAGDEAPATKDDSASKLEGVDGLRARLTGATIQGNGVRLQGISSTANVPS